MTLLRVLRFVAFGVCLIAASVGRSTVHADPLSCDGYDWCGYCDAGSRCIIATSEQCENYTGCHYVGICSGNTGSPANMCGCDPC